MPIEKPIGLVNKKTGKLWAGENYGEQSQESYDKLFAAGKLNPVQQGIDRFGNYLTTSAQADPIVGSVLNFLGASVRTITNVLPKPIQQGVGFVLDKNQEAAENIAAATGLPVSLTDPMTIADAVMGGAVTATRPAVKTAVRETLQGAATIGRNLPPPGPQLVPVGAGAAPRVQLNVSGGKANLAPQVMELTATKNLTDVVVPGVGSSEKYKIGVQKLRELQATGIKKRANYQKQLDNKEITQTQYNSRMEKLKKTEDAKYSTLATEDDPDIFETPSQIQRDPTNPILPAHQHHATGKAMTSPWVQAALELGDDDDVVALFELHRKLLNSGMGNVKSGIIDMPGFAHIARDARIPEDVPMSVHSFMKKSGADIEIVSKRVKKIIGEPKNMDELMDKYITFAEEYLIPQKNLSLKRLNQVLTEHKKTLSPAQQVKFDKLVSKLNKANT